MTLSVVVISFNQRLLIERLIGQLLDQSFAPDDYEVIVVECNSQDQTADWLLAQSDARLRPVILSHDCNRSAARNRGILESRGRIVVMIDGDHTISPDFLVRHSDAHAPGVRAIVGKSIFAPDPEYRAISTYLDGSGAAKLPIGTMLPGRYFLTRNCSVPRDVLIDIGLFDEQFDQWGGEDLDLGVRLERAGIPIIGAPQALAVHHHFRTLPEVMRVIEAYGAGSVPRLLGKHPQLFRELSLDWLYHNPFQPDQFSRPTRLLHRLLCSALIYTTMLSIAQSLRRFRLPRVLLDYLHLRQYAKGYCRAAGPKL